MWNAAKEKLGISDVTTGYGMTECGSTTTMFSPNCTTEELIGYQGYRKDCGCAGDGALTGNFWRCRFGMQRQEMRFWWDIPANYIAVDSL